MESILTKRFTIIVVALVVLWKAFLSATLQLHPDEAYYWLWSRHLDSGYFDHAPLIAYAIRLTTLFSQQELWVRFSGILGTIIVSVLAWTLARQMFRDRKIASASVITLNTLPLTLAGSVVITPDVPVFLFVSLGLYSAWQIVATKQPGYWYLLGVVFGLALLSKYTAVLLAPSVFLFLLMTDERRWLKTVHPYAAFLLGCAFFIPVIYWNSQHEWMSFVFQVRHGLGGETYSPGKVLRYIGGQMLVAGPVLWVIGAFASVLYLVRRDKPTLFLSLAFLTTVLFFAYSSLKRSAAANWPCFAYFPFSILVGHYVFSRSGARRGLWAAGVLLGLVLALTTGLHARYRIIPLERLTPDAAQADATQAFYGWRELARELEKDASLTFAVTSTHQVAAEVSYYTRERIFTHVNDNQSVAPQFGIWADPEKIAGTGGVCIKVEGDRSRPCADYFASTGSAVSLPVTRSGFPVREYTITRGSGYKAPSLTRQ